MGKSRVQCWNVSVICHSEQETGDFNALSDELPDATYRLRRTNVRSMPGISIWLHFAQDTCPRLGVVLLKPYGRRKKQLVGIRGRMSTKDPIIAAIEAHRRARDETCATYERQTAVENKLATGGRVPVGEVEYDPEWIAANNAVGEALAVQDDLAVKLVEIQPRTTAGAVALLTYYVDVITTEQSEVVFPELDVNGRLFESKSINEPRKDFLYFLVRNVAAALSNMAAAESGCVPRIDHSSPAPRCFT